MRFIFAEKEVFMDKRVTDIESAYNELVLLKKDLASLKEQQENVNTLIAKLRKNTNSSNKIKNDLFIFQYNKQLDDINESQKRCSSAVKELSEKLYNATLTTVNVLAVEESNVYGVEITRLLLILAKLTDKASLTIKPVKTGVKYSGQHIGEIIKTSDKKKDNRIARVIRHKIVDEDGKTLISPIVSVYTYDRRVKGETPEEVDSSKVKKIKEKASFNPFKYYLEKSYSLAGIIATALFAVIAIVLFVQIENYNLIEKLSQKEVFTVKSIKVLIVIFGVTVLCHLAKNTFCRDAGTIWDYSYPFFIIFFVSTAIYYNIAFNEFRLTLSAIAVILVVLLYLLRIFVREYAAEDIFYSENAFINYLYSFFSKFGIHTIVTAIGIEIAVFYLFAHTQYVFNPQKTNMGFIIFNYIAASLLYVSTIVFTGINLKSTEIKISDFALFLDTTACIIILVCSKTANLPLSVSIIAWVLLLVTITTYVLRIYYRKKVYEV